MLESAGYTKEEIAAMHEKGDINGIKNIFKLFAGLLFAFYLLLGTAFPAEAGIISKQQEIEMGRETAMALEAQYGVVQDYELQERVNRIGQSLVAVSDRQDLEYTFKVLNCDEVNALACPGGFVYVFKGLIDYMPSDSELAGVLGHEVSHIVEKHTVHQIEKQLLTTPFAGCCHQGRYGAYRAGFAGTGSRLQPYR